jgi:predicted nucleotidyltransferase
MLYLTKEKIQTALSVFKQKLAQHFPQKLELYVFGSAARGDFQPESDIDVLVIIDQPVDVSLKEQIFHLAFEVELECDVVFGVLVHSKQEWDSALYRAMPIHWSVDKDGIKV